MEMLNRWLNSIWDIKKEFYDIFSSLENLWCSFFSKDVLNLMVCIINDNLEMKRNKLFEKDTFSRQEMNLLRSTNSDELCHMLGEHTFHF